MRKKSMHVVLMASVLVFSSIAGCLGNDDEKEEDSFTVIAFLLYEYAVDDALDNCTILSRASVKYRRIKCLVDCLSLLR